jgi:hypothetical protein
MNMYVIYCMTVVAMILLRLRLDMANLSTSKSTNSPMFTEASICCAWNSGVLTLSSYLDRLITGRFSELSHLIKSQFYRPISVQNVFITKLFEPWIIYKGMFNCKFLSDWQQVCCVFNKYLRKYYCGAKKYRYCVKKMLTCVQYV